MWQKGQKSVIMQILAIIYANGLFDESAKTNPIKKIQLLSLENPQNQSVIIHFLGESKNFAYIFLVFFLNGENAFLLCQEKQGESKLLQRVY